MKPSQGRTLIFIVAYNHTQFIESVLDRIPQEVWDQTPGRFEILVSDDASSDDTAGVCRAYAASRGRSVTVQRNPKNLGYGGNQKVGYAYAVRHGFDYVVLLHGDGQYDPSLILDLIQPLEEGRADAVLGSRMIHRKDALKGGMPLYKFFGNILLTRLQNFMLGTKLAEFHTGYRTYRVSTLASIPYLYNSDYFDFDTDILLQLVLAKGRIVEIAIPTFYGDETSHVNSIRYALLVLRSTFFMRLYQLGMYYHPRFEIQGASRYPDKTSFASSHTYALRQVPQNSSVLDIGHASGNVARKLFEAGCEVYTIDREHHEESLNWVKESFVLNLNEPEDKRHMAQLCEEHRFDRVLLLDVLEHLISPEDFLHTLRMAIAPSRPHLIITTPNIAFISVRIGLLFGRFNYTSRGVLDYTHTRHYTFASLKRILTEQGFEILSVTGIPAPFPLVVTNKVISHALLMLNKALISILPGMFSYQIAIEAAPLPTPQMQLHTTQFTSAS